MKPAPHIPAIVSLIAAAALATACGGTAPTASNPPAAVSGQTTTSPAVRVDEGLLSVDVTIARSLLDPDGKKTDEELVQGVKEKGMSAVVNADQTITYTMTRRQQQELLDGMRTSVRESVAEIVDDGTSSITAVDFSDDMTSFTAKVDGKRYSGMDAFYALAFYVPGALYQQFDGVPAESVDVKVQFVDEETGNVLGSSSYSDWLKSQAE